VTSDLRMQVNRILHLAENIDERTERIDIRTEGHTGQLSIGSLRSEMGRIADALEKIGERHAKRMFTIAVIGLILLTTIIFLLISAYTGTPIKVGGNGIISLETAK
jgi:hypothetical protein